MFLCFLVVKPKKKCVVTNESTFSVTGFLTFSVVAATSVANLIANINNNNDNNNNNNNQDNINNNNQKSSSADATNQGNARNLQIEGHKTFEDMKNNNQKFSIEDSNNRSRAHNLQMEGHETFEDIKTKYQENNQKLSNADTTNQDRAHNIQIESHETFEEIQNNSLFCYITKTEASNGELQRLMTTIFGYYLADILPNFDHDMIPKIMTNPNEYC